MELLPLRRLAQPCRRLMARMSAVHGKQDDEQHQQAGGSSDGHAARIDGLLRLERGLLAQGGGVPRSRRFDGGHPLQLMRSLQWQQHLRGLTTQPLSKAPPSTQEGWRALLASHPTWAALQDELDMEAERGVQCVPWARFVVIARRCGAAADEESAAQVLSTLQTAGVVLRHGDAVYLRGSEVADLVLLNLPGAREDAEAMLARVDQELRELDQVHAQLERRSRRLTNALLGAGFVVLVTQFVLFIYLTWWELSWDVMEPFSYIIQLFYTTLAAAYFLWAGHAFDLKPIQDFWAKRFRDSGAERLKFDAERHKYLTALQGRYRKHLASVHRA